MSRTAMAVWSRASTPSSPTSCNAAKDSLLPCQPMATTGRAAIFHGLGQPFEIKEYLVPEPEPGAAVVRITLANVCGSDLHTWRGDLDPIKRGRALPIHQGHEGTGRVAALGEGVATDSNGLPLAVGDRVVFAYFFPCGHCRACVNGRDWTCPNRMHPRATSCEVWPHFKGTFGDYFYLYPNHMVFKVPDDLSDEVVAGVNCAMAQVTCGWGADVVMEVGGFPRITEEGLQMVASGGRYVEIGNISPGLTYQADPALWVTQNITIYGNNHYGRRHLFDALSLLKRGSA